MQSEIFEQTTSITSTATEVFNSETYSVDVANAVLMGVSITNTGSANAQLQVDIKVHPDGAWITHTTMGASSGLAPTNTTNVSNTFYRVTGGLNDAIVNANSNGYFSVNLKFVYAIRILSRMASGSSGNSIRVRGNIKKAIGEVNYQEKSFYAVPATTVTNATIPLWVDTSSYAYFSATLFCTGTNTFQNIAANTLPNQPSGRSGYLLAMRFYPEDTNYYYLDAINTGSAIAGNKSSMLIRSHLITASERLVPFVALVDAAYEMGFIFNIPGGSNIDCHISLNG